METATHGTICIARRLSLQDIVRTYTVLIDGAPAGKFAPWATKDFEVPVGEHVVQLRITGTGNSRSEEFQVEVGAGETRLLRTRSLGLKSWIVIPLGILNPDRFAPRPWIRLALEPRHKAS